MIVVDASSLVEFLLRARSVPDLEKAIRETNHIAVPMVTDFETLNVLRKQKLKNAITTKRAEEAISDYLDMPLQRFGTEVLYGRMWELRNNLTSYDAAYVALAELLRCPLYSSDEGMLSAPHQAQIIHVKVTAP